MSLLRSITEGTTSAVKGLLTPKKIRFVQVEEILSEAKVRAGIANISNGELLSKLKIDKEFKAAFLSKIEGVLSEKGITGINGNDIINTAKRLESIKEKLKIEGISARHIEQINMMYEEIAKETGVKNPFAFPREYRLNPNVRRRANAVVDKYLKGDSLDSDLKAVLEHLKQSSKNGYFDIVKSIRDVHLSTLSGGEKAKYLITHVAKQSGKYTIHAYIPTAQAVSSLSAVPMHAVLSYLPGVRNVSGPLFTHLTGTSGIFRSMVSNLESYANAWKEFRESQSVASASAM